MTLIGLVRDDGSKLDFDHPSAYREHIRQFAGHEVEIDIRKRRSKRSDRQNRWLHSFLKDLAEHLGYSLAELKLVGLVALFGTVEIMGYTVPAKPHTSELNTNEFSDLCEWFVMKAAECNFVVLYPEEFKREQKKSARRGATVNRVSSQAVVGVGESFEAVSASAAPGGG